ncbi:MAG: hypothetical protein SVM86_03035, partial [Candidatus Cloacimonadota bacterium]|nr:hypothetical protein [Candidatus Cloacimonadota bacterium]
MSVYIKSVRKNSLAAKAGLKKKFQLLSINENHINNFLDLQFYANEEILKIKFIDNNDNLEEVTIFKESETNLGIEIFSKKCRTCCNNCIFCFVDQMPSKMRKSLYLKDDDYVFSFIYGNFITLTNLSNIEFDRIIEQHISPLYISVHTTNPVLHKKMLRYKKKDFNILNKLKQLSAAGIQMHTQIVVVPGWNNGT